MTVLNALLHMLITPEINAQPQTLFRRSLSTYVAAQCHRMENGLVGLVGMASASRAEDPGFKSCLWRDFSGSNHTIELNIGTPVATMPGTWQYSVSTGTARPSVSIL